LTAPAWRRLSLAPRARHLRDGGRGKRFVRRQAGRNVFGDGLRFLEPVGIRQPQLARGDAAGLDAAVGVAAASVAEAVVRASSDVVGSVAVGGQDRRSPLSRHPATNHDPAQEDHNGHNRGRHEQEHELLPVQLDLVKSFI
jgi:hypothetical protein